MADKVVIGLISFFLGILTGSIIFEATLEADLPSRREIACLTGGGDWISGGCTHD